MTDKAPVRVEKGDQRILTALNHYTRSRNGMIPAQIYAAGDGSGFADFGTWYVTGPKDRWGFISGPIHKAVVMRLADKGLIVPDVKDLYGKPVAYVLPKFARTALGGRGS